MAKIKIDKEKCKGCALCAIYCPKRSITVSDKLNKRGAMPACFKNNSNCTGCAFCAIICPECAIEVYR